jgi:hypothetical protein
VTAPETCEHCGADLRGAPIPQEHLDQGHHAPSSTHYLRTIGVELRGVYDGVLYWMCPDCGGTWHRWPEGHELRSRAAGHMRGPAA